LSCLKITRNIEKSGRVKKKSGDPLGYFDNFHNRSLNKYKKILKIKKVIYIYMCVCVCFSTFRLMVIQIYAISLSFDSPSKTIKFSCNLQRNDHTPVMHCMSHNRCHSSTPVSI
jgi:hypothetical protein